MIRARFASILLCLGLWLALSYTTSDLGLTAPNERSRLYLTVALFEQHTYCIDAVRAHFGPVFDQARFAGHYYTDKAPGASLLALIPYALLRLFVDARDVTLVGLILLARHALMVPIGIASFFVFEAVGRTLGLGRAAIRWCSFAYLFATPAFHYSAAFFGHQIVACAIALSILCILRQARREFGEAWRLLLAAGACSGLAVITEYQALIAALATTALVVIAGRRRLWSSLLVFGLGAAPFAAFLAHYHTSCFGGPFELSYHHLVSPILSGVHRQGVGGVSLPTVPGILGVLLSHHRGVAMTSPFMLLAVPGFCCLVRRGYVHVASVFALFVTAQLAFVAASATWEAGWGFGARLLIPCLPVLCLLVAAALDEVPSTSWRWKIANGGLLVGLASFQCVTALFAEPPESFKNPWLDLVLPLAARGLVAPNLASELGVGGWLSIVPLAVVVLGLWWLASRERMSGWSGRSVAWTLVVPAVVAGSIAARGPSTSERERRDFITFVRQLRTECD